MRERTILQHRAVLPYAATTSGLPGRAAHGPLPVALISQRDRGRPHHLTAGVSPAQAQDPVLSPRGRPLRTRLTHTLEVAQIARTHRPRAVSQRGSD